MDIQEMIEVEKRRQQAIQDEKLRTKLRRQIRIFNQEKESYERKTANELNKFKRSIDILHSEKHVQLDNYLATQSSVIDNKYKQDGSVVKGLVKTTGIVRNLLKDETTSNKKLQQHIDQVKAEECECRRNATDNALERNKFRVPSYDKMDSRVQHANARYHTQRHRNIQLQEKIDNALIMRSIGIKEDARLTKQLDSLSHTIQATMKEASNMYEDRDRNEGTRLKVTEHLAKVKENYMTELLTLTTALTEDKDMETFMRTKQKDIGGFIRERTAAGRQKIKDYLSKKDEYTVIFDRIKEAIGKNNIREIIQDFVDKESDNFSAFISIGELLDEDEKLRGDIQEMSSDNMGMEMMDLDLTSSQKEKIQAAQNRIASLKGQTVQCHKRMEENKQTTDEFVAMMSELLGVLKLDSEKPKLQKPGTIPKNEILAVLTTIEEAIAVMLHDFTMVELSGQITEDLTVSKASIDNHMITSHGRILTPSEVKDYIVKAMKQEKAGESSRKSRRKSTP